AHLPPRAARRQQAGRRPQAVTRRLSARYREWPFPCGPAPDSGAPARYRFAKIDPREEDTMHPEILRQLAAEHIRDLIPEAAEAQRAREARRTQRRRLAGLLRRATRLPAQQPGSRRRSRIPVSPAAEGRVEASR